VTDITYSFQGWTTTRRWLERASRSDTAEGRLSRGQCSGTLRCAGLRICLDGRAFRDKRGFEPGKAS